MTIEKREQVFISSTFQDLIDERRAVLQTLLEADCLPAGMELFPASDNDKFDLIKGVIELSDYYVVIVGGRYGSVDEVEQLSYTEMEFDYAVKQKKPVMGFLHGEPGKIIADKTDLDGEMRKKLDAFRAKVETRMVKYWTTPDDLAGKVALALMQTRKSHPAAGWVRGENAMTSEVVIELAELRAKVAELTAELSAEKSVHQALALDDLAEGDEEYAIALSFEYWPTGSAQIYGSERAARGSFEATWDRIFAYLAPSMMDEANEHGLHNRLSSLGREIVQEWYDEQPEGHEWGVLRSAKADINSLEDVLVQLKALGLIDVSDKKHGVADKATYWRLTAKGTSHMMKLRTITRFADNHDAEDLEEPEA
ncbi:DUF4062 domain-containing protein [Nocardioides eburneiflavus]|uniref:DUF4062 domain-containing protein n=1 Tax=Nocardioides eburneiflavus TaxID=2518372 RepID=A0A4Z1CIG6_9ACTN|nr:DUF4062 domain-containing protein [Nocardioides eburneiflavus]TGN63023.1 DUF4062 domain-containing protein [Nocardioides eburneiflavus]